MGQGPDSIHPGIWDMSKLQEQASSVICAVSGREKRLLGLPSSAGNKPARQPTPPPGAKITKPPGLTNTTLFQVSDLHSITPTADLVPLYSRSPSKEEGDDKHHDKNDE
jgi:hypothetical protein